MVQSAPADEPLPARTFQTKENYVAEFLREGILSGRFARGARLKQAEIAQTLNISITPVREAFRILEAEGYVISVEHRGVIVAPFDGNATRELTELRVLLECKLVQAAITKMTPADHRTLSALEKEFEKAAARGDHSAVRATNYRLHRFIYTLAGEPQTLHFVQVLWARYPFDVINLIRGRFERAAREHHAIIRAIKSRNRRAAVAAVRRHIETGCGELVKYLEQGPRANLAAVKQADIKDQ